MASPAYGADSTLLTFVLLRPTTVPREDRFRMYVYPLLFSQVCDALIADELLFNRLRTFESHIITVRRRLYTHEALTHNLIEMVCMYWYIFVGASYITADYITEGAYVRSCAAAQPSLRTHYERISVIGYLYMDSGRVFSAIFSQLWV